MLRNSFYSKKTSWANKRDDETIFVKRLTLASILYLELKKKFGEEKAFEIIREIIIPIGCNEQWKHLNSLNLKDKTPMEKLMMFNDLMDKKGAPRFNKREYIEKSKDTCHFIIKRCIFHDFFTEVGTPELTKIFCEVDKEFFPKAFPEFKFHRKVHGRIL